MSAQIANNTEKDDGTQQYHIPDNQGHMIISDMMGGIYHFSQRESLTNKHQQDQRGFQRHPFLDKTQVDKQNRQQMTHISHIKIATVRA